MMPNRWNGACALFLLASWPAFASEGLLDVLAQAKAADPNLRGASFVQSADMEAVQQARARLLPSAAFTFEEKDTSEDIIRSENIVTNGSSASYGTTTYTLTLNQSIYNHEYWVRYRQSKVVSERAVIDYDRATQDFLISVAERYFTILKTEEQLGAISAEKEALKSHVDYATKSRRVGLGRRAEVVDAEARYFTALAEEARFIKDLDDARYALMEMTGELHNDLRPIQEQLPMQAPEPSAAQAWIDRGLSQSPDVLSQQYSFQEAQMEVKAQNAGHLPTLDLVFRNINEDQGGSLFGGATEVETQEMALQLNIPLYQGGSVSSRKRQAIDRMYKSQEDLVRIQRQVTKEVNTAFQGVIANIAQVEALQRTLASQQEVLKNKERGLQAGLYPMLAVLDAQRDLANAQRNYIEARYDYAINSLKLKRAAGVLTEDDLVAISHWLQ